MLIIELAHIICFAEPAYDIPDKSVASMLRLRRKCNLITRIKACTAKHFHPFSLLNRIRILFLKAPFLLVPYYDPEAP